MDLSHALRLAEMAVDMTGQPDLDTTLDRVMSHARERTACDAVGVLLSKDHGTVETAAATEALVKRADDLQIQCGEGPCLYAIRTQDTFVITDTADDGRWPVWGPKVASLGWRAVLSVRLFTPERTLGALNLYSRNQAAFDDEDAVRTEIFGRHASVALMTAQSGANLRRAVAARHLVGQAQGILMERYRIDADQAFGVLRRYSQDRNVKLRVIAEHVVATHRLPD